MEPRRQKRAHGPHTGLQLIFTYELKDCNLRTQTKAYSCMQADLGTSCLRTRQRTAGVIFESEKKKKKREKCISTGQIPGDRGNRDRQGAVLCLPSSSLKAPQMNDLKSEVIRGELRKR